MALPVVTVAAGGMPVVDVTSVAPLRGMPITEAANGRGLAVTKVTAGKPGMPVTYTGGGGGGGGTGTITTWNPSDRGGATPLTLSNGNLTAASTASTDAAVRSTTNYAAGSGKLYWEHTLGAAWAGGDTGLGAANANASNATFGQNATNGVIVFPSGATYVNGSNITNTTGALAAGHNVGVALDLINNRIWFRRNGGFWNASSSNDPATNVGGLDVSAVFGGANVAYAAVAINSSGSSITVNFGATAFSYTAPSGFLLFA